MIKVILTLLLGLSLNSHADEILQLNCVNPNYGMALTGSLKLNVSPETYLEVVDALQIDIKTAGQQRKHHILQSEERFQTGPMNNSVSKIQLFYTIADILSESFNLKLVVDGRNSKVLVAILNDIYLECEE